jgi:hypothetical protein
MDHVTYAAILLDVRDIGECCLNRTQAEEEYKTRNIPCILEAVL